MRLFYPRNVQSTLKRRFASGLALVAGLFATSEAAAQAGPRALVFCGDGGYCSTSRATLSTNLVAAGAQGVDESTALTNLTNYRMIFVEVPTTGLTPANQATLLSFYNAGGVIIAVADSQGFAPTAIASLNGLATQAGISIQFLSSSLDTGCGHSGTTQMHSLAANWSVPTYAWSGNTNTAGDLVLSGETGQGLVRVEGRWVAVADSQLIDDLCGVSTNGPFFQNLWTYFSNLDTDGDGVLDNVDNCDLMPNADQADADMDGEGDVCDACPLDADNDFDFDGVCGDMDNCPVQPNSDQADGDGDGAGDLCDVCPADAMDDADADGLCADMDNCPALPNANQADGDSDGVGDLCDVCISDPTNDADSDGVCGEVDNCAMTPNANQADADKDGVGDACDDTPPPVGGAGGGAMGGGDMGGSDSGGSDLGSGGGGAAETPSDGCDCAAAGPRGERSGLWALLGAALIYGARRRRS